MCLFFFTKLSENAHELNEISLLSMAKIEVLGVLPFILTYDVGCGHCFRILSTVDLCRFCVLSIHREVGSV